MADTWHSKTVPDIAPMTVIGWGRVIGRGVPLALLIFGGLVFLLLVRLIEWPLFGQRRPLTPYITQFVCRAAFIVLQIRFRTLGQVMKESGAVVSNHSTWLDIFALNARKRIYFVAKSEVASWAGIGWLARATGTVFIRRDRRDTKSQITLFQDRLLAGHKLLFFPEGTSTDGRRVLPFKPTLFAAFFDPDLAVHMRIQPVTVAYDAPAQADPRFYGWWGGMDLVPHLLAVLSVKKQGSVTVQYHPPVALRDFDDRKALAAALQKTVQSGLITHCGAQSK